HSPLFPYTTLFRSKFNPLYATISALDNFITSDGVGWYPWGSIPGPISPSTSTASPPISLTKSVSIVVVATTFNLSVLSALLSVCAQPANRKNKLSVIILLKLLIVLLISSCFSILLCILNNITMSTLFV